ncbi:MAG TPA: archease [archaeon]|nr:archease [archaeon]
MHKFFEHKADIGIIGYGTSLEEAFAEGAKAMFEVMVDIKKVKKTKAVKIKCEASNNEELFVEFLNKLLYEKDVKQMAFCDFHVKIKGNKLTATAYGEKFDAIKHKVKTEVKAATYSQLKIEKKGNKYYAQCVVDV